MYEEEALLEFFQHANSVHPNIRFTYTFGKMVDDLDATLRINGQSITSDLFMKPTDTHQYLQCIQKFFSQTLFDFKKSISGPIELKFSGKTLYAIL